MALLHQRTSKQPGAGQVRRCLNAGPTEPTLFSHRAKQLSGLLCSSFFAEASKLKMPCAMGKAKIDAAIFSYTEEAPA